MAGAISPATQRLPLASGQFCPSMWSLLPLQVATLPPLSGHYVPSKWSPCGQNSRRNCQNSRRKSRKHGKNSHFAAKSGGRNLSETAKTPATLWGTTVLGSHSAISESPSDIDSALTSSKKRPKRLFAASTALPPMNKATHAAAQAP